MVLTKEITIFWVFMYWVLRVAACYLTRRIRSIPRIESPPSPNLSSGEGGDSIVRGGFNSQNRPKIPQNFPRAFGARKKSRFLLHFWTFWLILGYFFSLGPSGREFFHFFQKFRKNRRSFGSAGEGGDSIVRGGFNSRNWSDTTSNRNSLSQPFS